MPRQRRSKKGKPSPVSQELTSLVRKLGRGQRGVHPEIWARWRDIVGPELARRVFPRRWNRGVLVVAVSNSAWMQELSFVKATLIEKIVQEVGPGEVLDIQLTLDTTLPSTSTPQTSPAAREQSRRQCPEAVETAVRTIDDDDLRSVIQRAVDANLKG
jgi:hypothetical protein